MANRKSSKAPAKTTKSRVVDAQTNDLTALLKAGGDPLRLEILCVLARDSFGVLELVQLFEAKQSGMSHHLKVLAKVGLVITRREGNTIFYRRSLESLPASFEQLRTTIYAAADQLLLSPSVVTQRALVYQQRASNSQEFFLVNSESFKEQQELIASFDSYGPQVAELIDAHPPAESLLALEVGPGTGEFLPELNRRFKRVVALDSSKEMLAQSRVFGVNNGLEKIVYIHADTTYCAGMTNKLDCIVINMVLHHTPSPGQIFADVAKGLKPGGILLVCDLSAHDQDWVREACGDQWLGFEPSDLAAWASDNALSTSHNSFFALRNGFQIQIHQFTKPLITKPLNNS